MRGDPFPRHLLQLCHRHPPRLLFLCPRFSRPPRHHRSLPRVRPLFRACPLLLFLQAQLSRRFLPLPHHLPRARNLTLSPHLCPLILHTPHTTAAVAAIFHHLHFHFSNDRHNDNSNNSLDNNSSSNHRQNRPIQRGDKTNNNSSDSNNSSNND